MIDFRSDTVTKPTASMREAMQNAVVGDDVYGDDPTINKLEAYAATLTGKDAALFVPSGTMGNQIAIMAHTKRGDEIIVGANSHIKNYEVGAAAVLSGVSYHLVPETRGMLNLDGVKQGIRGQDIHYPDTGLICIENAHGTGVVGSLEWMQAIHETAQANRIPVHLDGARVFNAAVHLNVEVKTMLKYTDSAMFCLSKGLASPIGSMLVGEKAFIERARKMRKLLGGGMRQVGVLGAPGFIALESMRRRLKDDHTNADYLAQELDKIDSFTVNGDARDINMVFVTTTLDQEKLADYLRTHDIIISASRGETMRFVCHNDIQKESIDKLIDAIHRYIKKEAHHD